MKMLLGGLSTPIANDRRVTVPLETLRTLVLHAASNRCCAHHPPIVASGPAHGLVRLAAIEMLELMAAEDTITALETAGEGA